MMREGTVKCIVQTRGFGFVSISGSNEDAFFHQSDLLEGLDFNVQLRERRVTFDLTSESKGLRARRLRPAD